MIVLDVTVFILGRMQVMDDLHVEEVLLLPSVSEREVEVIQKTLQEKDSPFALKQNVFLATMASLYSLTADDMVFHEVNELPGLAPEPELEEDDPDQPEPVDEDE